MTHERGGGKRQTEEVADVKRGTKIEGRWEE